MVFSKYNSLRILIFRKMNIEKNIGQFLKNCKLLQNKNNFMHVLKSRIWSGPMGSERLHI